MYKISIDRLMMLVDPVIIDIRSSYSYNMGHINGARNVPYYNLLNNLLSNSLKNITVLNVILSNRFLEAIFMIIFMIILMFIGSRLLTILKGGTKNEN